MRIASTITAMIIAGSALLFNACSTPVAVNSNSEPVAKWRAGVLYGQLAGDYQSVFRAVNKSLDELGFIRMGEIPEKTAMTIVAREVGDKRVQVRLTRSGDQANVIKLRIAYDTGDLPKSQIIFNKVASNL